MMKIHDPRLPGIDPRGVDDNLDASLKKISHERRAGAPPRTRHREEGGEPTYVNRLAREASPYLLQHAHNPVNWFPWGEEAFARARALDRPIFLSVGYSTCHWCHVMEEESFENLAIATYLNEHFVAIKVDREERPDVDATYMAAVQAMRGQGGWPMTVILTPELEPFFAATYLPPHAGVRGARMGLDAILERLAGDFANHRDKIVATAKEVTAHLVQASRPRPPAEIPDANAVRSAAARISMGYDSVHGGFGGAPKFPRPVNLELLLRVQRRTGDSKLRDQVLHTLEAMADGGMNDQLGGGFHRYSTDPIWRVPHFEKMLYDNALLSLAYLEAWQITGKTRYRETLARTLDYLLREMQAPEGCFYAATDADSLDPKGELEEGAFFTWTPEELEALLTPEDAKLAIRTFGVTHRGDLDGRTVLHRSEDDADLARAVSLSETALKKQLAAIEKTLLTARAKRHPPHRDEKILVAWNGLVLSALARAGFALERPDYLAAARKCADRVHRALRVDGALHHSMTGSLLSGPAFLDDHAFLAAGLIDLFEATGQTTYLEQALTTMAELDPGFLDGERGGYFQTGRQHETLITREKPDYDGALPSGNSVAAQVHLRLFELTGDPRQRSRADGILQAQGSLIVRAGPAVPLLTAALERRLDQALEIVLVQPAGDPGEALLSVLRRTYLPNRALLIVPEAEVATLAKQLPIVAGKVAQRGAATVYVCREGVCKLPTRDPAILKKQLAQITPL